MKARIHNRNFDVEIEGDDKEDVLKQLAQDYPERAKETIIVEWNS